MQELIETVRSMLNKPKEEFTDADKIFLSGFMAGLVVTGVVENSSLDSIIQDMIFNDTPEFLKNLMVILLDLEAQLNEQTTDLQQSEEASF